MQMKQKRMSKIIATAGTFAAAAAMLAAGNANAAISQPLSSLLVPNTALPLGWGVVTMNPAEMPQMMEKMKEHMQGATFTPATCDPKTMMKNDPEMMAQMKNIMDSSAGEFGFDHATKAHFSIGLVPDSPQVEKMGTMAKDMMEKCSNVTVTKTLEKGPKKGQTETTTFSVAPAPAPAAPAGATDVKAFKVTMNSTGAWAHEESGLVYVAKVNGVIVKVSESTPTGATPELNNLFTQQVANVNNAH